MEIARKALRVLLALLMTVAGIAHFTATASFVAIVPPWLPAPTLAVWVSGVAEIALGAALLVPRTRRFASFGLVALYVAVFPANLHMAMAHVQIPGLGPVSPAVAWGRLPLQLVLIAWALWVGRAPR
jgi:uncharacterized membrane protein